jgi:hypothetical protein
MSFAQMSHGLFASSLITGVLSAGLFTMGGASLWAILSSRQRAPGVRDVVQAAPAAGALDA